MIVQERLKFIRLNVVCFVQAHLQGILFFGVVCGGLISKIGDLTER